MNNVQRKSVRLFGAMAVVSFVLFCFIVLQTMYAVPGDELIGQTKQTVRTEFGAPDGVGKTKYPACEEGATAEEYQTYLRETVAEIWTYGRREVIFNINDTVIRIESR